MRCRKERCERRDWSPNGEFQTKENKCLPAGNMEPPENFEQIRKSQQAKCLEHVHDLPNDSFFHSMASRVFCN
jgi:hypothetical protein